MTDDCMGCRKPGEYSHAAYCPESRVEELRRDFEIEIEVNGVLRARLASVERERDEIMTMAERREGELRARLAEVERLLQEVYDGRQSLMSVGLVYRIGHTLNRRPADSASGEGEK